MSPRGRHMDCIVPLGHDRLDCGGGLGYGPDRPDYSRPMGASDPLDRVPDRIDYAEHGHMHHMGHDRFIDCGPGGPLPQQPPPPNSHDRLGGHHDFDGALIEERLRCGDPDANMNTMGKMGPHLRQSDGHLMAEDDIKDEYHFTGYGLIPARSCIDYPKRPMPPLTPADPEVPGYCAGCGGRILDRYYLHAVEKQWHMHCLTCSDCHFRLDSELTCFARDGNIYCKTDYYRRFAVKNCARCQMPISANELIMRAKDQVFHLTCFACTACNRTLKSGEQYGLKENLIYCRMDYELMFQGEFNMPSMSPGMGAHSPGGGGGPIPFYNGVGAVQKGRPRKRKSPMSDGDGCPPLGLGVDSSDRPGDVMDRDGYPHQTPRQKRVRTSFKHHQLRTMKSYFALNHNPDAKDLKQLAQKTGLSKRVLQVWFQNARAKYRRNLLKQQDTEGGNKAGPGGQLPDSPDGHDKEMMKDTGSIGDMTAGSPALSDISSTPSLSDIHSSAMETDHNSSSNNSISDLFTSTIATIN